MWISSLAELNVFYKQIGKASGKICPDLTSFLSTFSSSSLAVVYYRPVGMGIEGG